jgi:hypothetical protein
VAEVAKTVTTVVTMDELRTILRSIGFSPCPSRWSTSTRPIDGRRALLETPGDGR